MQPEGPRNGLHREFWELGLSLAVAMLAVPFMVQVMGAPLLHAAGAGLGEGLGGGATGGLGADARRILQLATLASQQVALLGLGLRGRRRLAAGSDDAQSKRHRLIGHLATGLAFSLPLLLLNGVSGRLGFSLFAALAGGERASALFAREQAVMTALLSAGAPAWSLAASLLMLVVTAPLAEEAFFRGYAYGLFRLAVPPARAALASAALFAAVHLYVVHFLPLLAMGWALAWLYERRGSLAAPVAAHAGVNFLVAAIALAVGL